MKKSVPTVLVFLVLTAVLLSACGGSSGTPAVARPTTPTEYANLTNPLSGNADAITAGKDLFAANCASCHGETGKGDGPAGANLDPRPADLTRTVKETTDGYQFFRILKGGGMDPVNSAMPSHEGILTDQQIWQIISYIQTWK